MGSCQNYGPFLGTLNIRYRIILGTQRGTLILTTTHMGGYQNYGPFLGPCYNTAPNILGYPNRGPNFDNHPYAGGRILKLKAELRPLPNTT